MLFLINCSSYHVTSIFSIACKTFLMNIEVAKISFIVLNLQRAIGGQSLLETSASNNNNVS